MSPIASQMLLDEILPLLTRTIPHTVYPSAGEDSAELVQDAVASAAEMLEAVEQAGKLPIPSSIAYYSIQRLKTGRRSYSASTTDVLSPMAQRCQGFSVTSLDAPVQGHAADDDGEGQCFGDLLVGRNDDPAAEACRRLDWDQFMKTQDTRCRSIIRQLAAGRPLKAVAAKYGISGARITQIKDEIGRDLRHAMGDDILAEVMAEPQWRRDLRAHDRKSEPDEEAEAA